ncbi:3-dehydroquinate synthase [soil metagenome]
MPVTSTTIRSNNYQVFLGNDTFYEVGKFLSRNNRQSNGKVFILVDDHTKEHCLPLLQRGVLAFQQAIILEIPHGESSKRIETIVNLWNELTANGADRHSVLVNLGGGMVTDVGGFTAATFMRGIDFINMPTTLLAMVDASVGGKNGINFGGFKNQVGTFDDPKAVFASPVFLKTLPENEMRSGFAEVIKHALISNYNKWREVKAIENFENTNWFEIIRESIWTKNKIVNSDYRDKHLRKALNFGHTIGHALESYSQKHHSVPLKHGEAIAIGMIGETYLSKQICGLNESDANDIFQFIRKYYPLTLDFDIDAIIEIMKGDKKNISDKINFSLIKAIGEPVINQNTDEATIRQALEFCKERLMVVG